MYHGGDLLGAPSRRPIRITRDTEGHLLFSNTE
jgi:hypothetical protein